MEKRGIPREVSSRCKQANFFADNDPFVEEANEDEQLESIANSSSGLMLIAAKGVPHHRHLEENEKRDGSRDPLCAADQIMAVQEISFLCCCTIKESSASSSSGASIIGKVAGVDTALH